MIRVISIMFVCAYALLGSSQASVISIDLSAGLPTGAFLNNNAIEYEGYRISSGGTDPITDAFIGGRYGFGVPTANTTPISISRIDGATFSLGGLNVFVAGTLMGGNANFDITPFDAAGIEGTPVQFSASQFLTTITQTGVTSTGQFGYTATSGGAMIMEPMGPFDGVTRLNIGSGVDYVTSLTLSVAAPTAVPVPGGVSLMVSGMGLLAWLMSKRESRGV